MFYQSISASCTWNLKRLSKPVEVFLVQPINCTNIHKFPHFKYPTISKLIPRSRNSTIPYFYQAYWSKNFQNPLWQSLKFFLTQWHFTWILWMMGLLLIISIRCRICWIILLGHHMRVPGSWRTIGITVARHITGYISLIIYLFDA